MREAARENHTRYVLAEDKDRVVRDILAGTGFKIKKELYHNFDTINGRYYTRSLIYRGKYKGMEAVLKIHGTKEGSYDPREIKDFERQNRSRLICAPKVYAHKNWERASGYGFTIFEYIGAPEIISRPFPTAAQLKDFSRFYQEYKTRAITKPWKEPPENPMIITMLKSVDAWLKNAQAKKRLEFEDHAPYLIRFHSMALEYAGSMTTEFMHMHLYPEHIHKQPNGEYVILDHMSWGYRLQWADLSYMIWRTILDIKDNNYSFAKFLGYVDRWISTFKKIPVVKKDKDFEKKITFLLSERSIGIILGDLGSGKFWGTTEGKRYFRHKLYLQQRLFNHLADRLENCQ